VIAGGGGVGGGRAGQKAYVSPGAAESAVFTISCADIIAYLLSYWKEIISIRILSTYVCRS
jgi:hypothetical protein